MGLKAEVEGLVLKRGWINSSMYKNTGNSGMGISKLIDFRALRESSFGGKGAVKVIDQKYGQKWSYLGVPETSFKTILWGM